MSDNLKILIHKITLQDSSFHENKDEELAKELYERHQLQSVLETASDFIKDGKLLKGCDHYLHETNTLINSAPIDWICVFVKGLDDQLTHSLCVGCLKTLSRVADPQVFEEREYYVFEKEDFSGLTHKGFLVLTVLKSLFERCLALDSVDRSSLKKCLRWICLVSMGIVARHMEDNLWTSSEMKALAKDVVQFQRDKLDCKTESDLLAMDLKSMNSLEEPTESSVSVKTSLYGMLLQQWMPLLQRNSWQKNPVVCASFAWCLTRLKFPHTSAFIELVIPPALLFVDDSILENKEMGIKCLIAIIENTSAEELRWYGRADVIFEALKLQMYRTEESLLTQVQKALLLILKVLVRKSENFAVSTKYDEIFLLLLQSATHENKLALRRVHTENLHHYIDCLGISVVKYINPLLDLIEEYMEISDPPKEEARFNVLKAFSALTKNAWPRMPAHSSQALRSPLKAIHQLTSQELHVPQSVKEELIVSCVECLKLLIAVDPSVRDKLNSLPYTDACGALIYPLVE